MDRAFWKGKKVLITGHTGFKGSWLSLWLQNCGAILAGYSLEPPTDPNLFRLADVQKGMESTLGDVRDLDNLKKFCDSFNPEIIIHLAAQSLVRYSYQNPVETFETNVMGTVNVLEAAKYTESIKVVVCITTDKCYENKEWIWGYRENEPMGGHDPYSSSKGCAELAIAAYRNSYFSNSIKAAVSSTRAGNVIGGGDWAEDRLLPDIMNTFIQGKPVIIRNPNAVRPWQHVLEPLNGYLILAEKMWNDKEKYSGAWNFGPLDSDAKPVEWIVNKMVELWGGNARWELDKGTNPHEAGYLKLDCAKANSFLGWNPKINLETALEWIIDWYKHFQEKDNMREVTERQIVKYEKFNQLIF